MPRASGVSDGVQILLRAGYKSRYTKFYRKQWRGRGTSITNLSWGAGAKAKIVTTCQAGSKCGLQC